MYQLPICLLSINEEEEIKVTKQKKVIIKDKKK